jgi:hypothetical protein
MEELTQRYLPSGRRDRYQRFAEELLVLAVVERGFEVGGRQWKLSEPIPYSKHIWLDCLWVSY